MNATFQTETIAERVLARHLAAAPLNHYAGIVTLHGLVNLAETTGRADLRRLSRDLLLPFYTGEIAKVGGAYDRMYRCGGNASALLVKYGIAPEALPALTAKAEELLRSHPRDAAGLFGYNQVETGKLWIDTVFAVCPFLAILGNLTGRREFIDEALHQMYGLAGLLRDRANGLFHQCINFRGPGMISEDHWSRGNGWAALALAELVTELPEDRELAAFYADFMESCRRVQDDDGLWHQEMTRPDSYVETSGSGLILYAIGRGLERKLLPEDFRDAFLKGLRAYLGYIALDGSVFHTCIGCLAPGAGKVEDYMNREWKRNDIHSFGPAVLAFGQAYRLGIRELSLREEPERTHEVLP